MLSLAEIQQARERIGAFVYNTPLKRSTTFSRMAGCEAWLKLENFQRTGSFKIRGALNKISTLTEKEKAAGVITASAGNHAQGVALAASTLGVKATICMPENAPIAKVEATRGYGAQVQLSGHDYNDAYDEARRFQETTGATFVHAFDDPLIMAGQGTLGLELLESMAQLDTVVVGIGGGGLIAGIATALKENRPDLRIVGVQATGADSAYRSFRTDHVVHLDRVDTIADGIATRHAGERPMQIIRKHVDEIVRVDDAQISWAMLMLLERAKTVVEGAGAVGLAALLAHKINVEENEKVVAVLSGGNVDMNFLGQVIHRGLMQEGRILRFSTIIQDKPGQLRGLIHLLAEMQANILTVNHDRDVATLDFNRTVVDIEVETSGSEHIDQILAKLRDAGHQVDVEVGRRR